MKSPALILIGLALGAQAGELTDGWTFDGEPVTVPHCWNAADGCDGKDVPPGTMGSHSAMIGSYARGKHTYACALPAKKAARRYFLECEGASIRATVRVNGVEVGRHEGAFTGFAFEITDALKADGNRLEIDVDNAYDPDSLPVCADFTVYGGLYRAVRLIEKPLVCIDPRVPVRIDADPSTGEAKAHYTLLTAAGAERKTAVRAFGRPELWCPENPKLYTFVIEEGEDRLEVPFGFRTAEFRDGFFRLNGKRLVLHGVNRHQDREGKGWAISAADEEEDVRTLKELGANAVRLSHYPQSRHFLDLCDRYGILVWSEVPLVDKVTETESFKSNCVALATEMVNERYNHPSVVLWSAFNELYNFKHPPMAAGTAEPYAQLVVDRLRSLDGTRPVVGASNQRRLKSLAAIPDAFGMNLYPGWYGSTEEDGYRGMVEQIAEVHRVHGGTFAVTEYGAGASFGQHGDPLDRPERTWESYHPLEYQAYLHGQNYLAICESPFVWGSFVWCLFDFGADARTEGGRPGLNDKGLVGFDHRTKKDAFYLYQANWRTDLPVLHLVGAERQETDAPCTSVLAFSNVGAVTLSVNGRKVGSQEPDRVKTVFWRNVPLALGTNAVEIAAGGLVRRCTLVRKAVRPCVPAFPDRTFAITDFGAKADGSPCTAAIAAAIEACAKSGGGRVVVPAGTWTTGAVKLGSGVDLHLADGATLVFSDDPADYLPAVETTWEGVECLNYAPLVSLAGCTNVAITGGGTLAPKMDTWKTWFKETPEMNAARERLYHWCSTNAPVAARNLLACEGARIRPLFIQAKCAKNVLLDGFRIRESPFWMIHLYRSEDCTVRNLDAAAHGFNNDGVDIEMTRNVLVENCRFDQGDDGIVLKAGRNRDGWRIGRPTENVEVRNCTFKFAHSLVAAGTELSGGIRNVWLHDCTIGSSYNLLYVKTNRRRGGFVENVLLENIDTDEVKDAVFSLKTDVLYQWAEFPDYELRRTRIRDITVRNVHAKAADRAIDATGDPACPPCGIRFENVTLDRARVEFSRVRNVEQ